VIFGVKRDLWEKAVANIFIGGSVGKRNLQDGNTAYLSWTKIQ
jgi:hypothetical protein